MRIAITALILLSGTLTSLPNALQGTAVVAAEAGRQPAPAAQAASRSPEALAKALQQRYERIRDFTADFVQLYRGGVLRTQAREQGTVAVRKPGMMRWLYTQPVRKEIVSDGRKLYMYFPSEKDVVVSDIPAGDDASTGAMFLAGRGDVSRDFTATPAEAVSGGVALKLTPRKPQPDYKHLVIELDPATLQIRALTTIDQLGGENAISFSNLKENTGISEKEFVFRMPRGVKVRTNDQSR